MNERKRQRALIRTLRAIEELGKEIRSREAGQPGAGSEEQLRHFMVQLERMKAELESGELTDGYLGMGHSIVDSWPYESELGEILLDAEQEFRNALSSHR